MGSRTIRIAAALAMGIALAIAAAISSDTIRVVDRLLSWCWVRGVILAMLLIGVAAAIGFTLPQPAMLSGKPAQAEAVVPSPTIPECRRKPPVISVHGLESQAGCTSIAFNLAVEVAAAGMTNGRRPRPICLLRAGPLTSTVGLDPKPFTDFCRSHIATVRAQVSAFAERHPSGCEVLCVADGVLDGHRLRLLISVLRRFYDLVVIDCPPGDRWLTDSAFDASEVSLLVGLPSQQSATAAVPWSDMSWRYGLDARFGLLVNRVTAKSTTPQMLLAAFANRAFISEDAVSKRREQH